MASVSPERLAQLSAAIQAHDFLDRVVREIERLQRVVFHETPDADWRNARRSAEQILIAEIVTRYGGNIDGVYFALRKAEQEGKQWSEAIRDLAAYLHSYYTTPLGIVMRRNLFGESAAFLSPQALAWVSKERS